MRWLMFCCLLSCAMSTPMRDQETPSEGESQPPAPAPEPLPTTQSAAPVGCTEAPYSFCATRRYRVEGIYFETGKDALMTSSTAALESIARALIAQPRLRVYVEVHSDAMGSASFNLVLSQKRADAIVKYLVGYGVPSSQLEAKGMGETVLINTGTTAAAHAENRRIELALHEGVK
jgi:outer membrane protein OmpA-like peptidoglycan-associated protein